MENEMQPINPIIPEKFLAFISIGLQQGCKLKYSWPLENYVLSWDPDDCEEPLITCYWEVRFQDHVELVVESRDGGDVFCDFDTEGDIWENCIDRVKGIIDEWMDEDIQKLL
jgi:hypothetical protein